MRGRRPGPTTRPPGCARIHPATGTTGVVDTNRLRLLDPLCRQRGRHLTWAVSPVRVRRGRSVSVPSPASVDPMRHGRLVLAEVSSGVRQGRELLLSYDHALCRRMVPSPQCAGFPWRRWGDVICGERSHAAPDRLHQRVAADTEAFRSDPAVRERLTRCNHGLLANRHGATRGPRLSRLGNLALALLGHRPPRHSFGPGQGCLP